MILRNIENPYLCRRIMAKILALDYGSKRTGIAATDDLQMMAFGVGATETSLLMDFLAQYFQENQVEILVMGESLHLDGKPNEIEQEIKKFLARFQKKYPEIVIEREDERYTSKIASQSLLAMGKKKKDRQNKYLIDEVSATLILQSYLERKAL